MKFNTCECKVLQLGQGNPREYRLGELIESSSAEKDLRGLVDENQHEPAMHVCGPESNCILGCIRRGNASRLREVILSFCSIILRPNLKYCIMSGGPQHKRDRNTLKRAQSRPWRTSVSWRASPMKQDDRKGIVHFGEDKALEKPYSSLPVPKGVL